MAPGAADVVKGVHFAPGLVSGDSDDTERAGSCRGLEEVLNRWGEDYLSHLQGQLDDHRSAVAALLEDVVARAHVSPQAAASAFNTFSRNGQRTSRRNACRWAEEADAVDAPASEPAGGGDVGAHRSFGQVFVDETNRQLEGCTAGRLVHYNRAQAATNTFWATALLAALLPATDILLWEFDINDSGQAAASFMLDNFLREAQPLVSEVVLVYAGAKLYSTFDMTQAVRERWRQAGVTSVRLHAWAVSQGVAPASLVADHHNHPNARAHRVLGEMLQLAFLRQLSSPLGPRQAPALALAEPVPQQCAAFVGGLGGLGRSTAKLAWSPRNDARGLPGVVSEIHDRKLPDRLDRKVAAVVPCCGKGTYELPLAGERLLTWRADGDLLHTVQTPGGPQAWRSHAEGRLNGCGAAGAVDGCGASSGALRVPSPCFLQDYWAYFADWQQVPPGATTWQVCSTDCPRKGRISWMAAFAQKQQALLQSGETARRGLRH